MPFCEFCGTRLEEEQECICPAAVQDREAPVYVPPPPRAPEATSTMPEASSQASPSLWVEPAAVSSVAVLTLDSASPEETQPAGTEPASSIDPVEEAPSEAPQLEEPEAASAFPTEEAPPTPFPQSPYEPPPGYYPPPEQGSYPPPGYPPPAHYPPPGYYPPPPPGYPPHGYPPPDQAGATGYAQGGYPPPPGSYPPGPPPYGYGPPPKKERGQFRKTLKEIKETLGSFVKDPYGAATQGHTLSLGVSFSLLALQALTFFLMVFAARRKLWGFLTRSYWHEDWSRGNVTFYLQTLFLAVVAIGVFFLVTLLASKIAKITISGRSLASTLAMSSIPLSAAFLTVAVLLFILGYSQAGMALYILLCTFGGICSILLLEIGLRSAMPAGTGNLTRLICLASSYAVTYGILFIFLVSMAEESILSLFWYF